MNTQKRESRQLPAVKSSRWTLRRLRQRKGCMKRAQVQRAEAWGLFGSASFVQYVLRVVGGTAPLLAFFGWLGALVATKFLHPDQPTGQLVQPDFETHRRGSPPPVCGPAPGTVRGLAAILQSPFPPTPILSGLTRLLLSLPQAPDGLNRRAERYDGKRDLYFVYAA